MVKLKGVYKWKLIDKDTNKVCEEGEQENLITDSLVKNFANNRGNSKSGNAAIIVLSKQSVLPTAEYREYDVISGSVISEDYLSPQINWTYDDPAGSKSTFYNFDPPVSPETYYIIGLHLRWYDGSWHTYKYQSFIVLTTPITQQTTQFLYVEYTLSAQYSGGYLNSPDNVYVKDFFNEDIWDRMVYFAYRYSKNDPYVRVTPFRPPVAINNVGRRVGYITNVNPATAANDGCRYGQTPEKSFITTDIPGPIGCPIWMYYNPVAPYENVVIGAYDTNIAPSISRVYVHPDANKDQVFSHPAVPPVSRAAITLSGTPTNKVPIVVRLKITKTGDASDISDETFTANPTTDELTVSQDDWDVDDVVRFTTTGTLPAPLATGTDYYIVTKSGSSPTVLIEVSITGGGSVVDITDAGSGIHTILRQISGRYRLTMEPCLNALESNVNVPYILNFNIIPMEDTLGNPKENDLRLGQNFALIGRDGDYTYTVNYSADENFLMICRQRLFSIESSVPLHSLFGISGVTLRTALRAKGTYANIVYIATTDGIYKYDISSPATPTLMSITGMLATDVLDLTFDEITEYLWAGHSNGMSKINLSTNIATPYDNAFGNALNGIPTVDINCQTGSLTAHNGYVFYGRLNGQRVWLLLDGTGYSQNVSLGFTHGSTIHKVDGNVIVRGNINRRWSKFNVTGITGINTGTWNLVESYDVTRVTSVTYLIGNILQLTDTKYQLFVYYSGGVDAEVYEVGVGVTSRAGVIGVDLADNDDLPVPQISNARVGIDCTENNMGLWMMNIRTSLTGYCGIIDYGWTGSAWDRNNSSDRQIPKTGTHPLGHGVSVQFNNAVGENWDKQFVLNEYFTFIISPVLVKDNLQEYTVKVRGYHCGVKRVVNWTTTIAANITVPEAPTGSAPDPDYRDLETADWVLEVYNITAAATMTQVVSPPGDGEYSVVGLKDGTFEFHTNQIGDSVRITYNYTCYW